MIPIAHEQRSVYQNRIKISNHRLHTEAQSSTGDPQHSRFMMKNELRDQMFQWAAVTNLNFVINFHNEVRRMIGNSLVELTNIEDGNAKQSKAEYRRFDEVLQVSTFLMIYSYAEEWLFLLCSKTPVPPDSHSSSIARFKPPLRDLGADLSSEAWQLMMDSEALRNCLLHANARVDLSRSRKKVERTVAKYPAELAVANKRLRVQPEFVERFAAKVHEFLTATGMLIKLTDTTNG